ncbi:MAG: MFS transporter [Actinocatenispora sp.]
MAFVFVAYAFGVTMLGTTLPTPLYHFYQEQFGFGNLLTTVIYAVYAGGVLAALLLFGRASDVLGRRRLLLAGLAVAALSAVVFLTDGGLVALFTGRVLSGVSAGIFTGTATVTLVELVDARHRRAATLLATVVNMLGLGCGPLLAGLFAEYLPEPLRWPFVANLAVLLPAAVGVWFSPETVDVRPGARPRPQRPAVPASVRPVFVPAAVAVFAAFSVFGLLTSIEPGFLADLLHRPDEALAGAVVFSMFAGSAIGQVGLARLPTRVALPTGCLVLVAGLAGIGLALVTNAFLALVVGTVVVGIGQGISFRAGMATVTEHSPPDRRAETVSSFFVVAYTGISVPVILVGVGSAVWGLRTAGIAFTVAVAALALGALVAVLRLARGSAATT